LLEQNNEISLINIEPLGGAIIICVDQSVG